MKFITEEDLRDLYKKEPFTTYEIEEGVRLTPGARQFLSDRGMNMFDDELKTIKKSEENVPKAAPKCKNNWKTRKLKSKMKSTEALFLIIANELLERDIILAQKVIGLSKQFRELKNVNLDCQECTGIKCDMFSDDLEDCFEITEFHMQLEKGKEVLALHRLKCALREIEPVILEVVEDGNEENKLYEESIGKINQIINTLSQMICIVVGGKECQKKS